MFSRLLSLTRYMVFIPVIGSWLAALILLAFGSYEIVLTVLQVPMIAGDKALKLLVLNLVEAVDLFLLGTAFYLIALGLYELFIDVKAPVPAWLEIHDLDDLKAKLISVLVVVLGVQFLAQALNWKGEVEILHFGAATGLVIAALAFYIAQKGKKSAGNAND